MSRKRFDAIQPWLSLAVRVSMAVIMLWAGFAKMADLAASRRAVRAYDLVPETFVPLIGNGLPFVEIAMGVVLFVGLFTRWSAFAYLALLGAFLIGLFWAWGNGLQIDCGCFGGGGDLEFGQTADYWGHLWERVGFVALGLWLAIFPRSVLSADRFLRISQ